MKINISIIVAALLATSAAMAAPYEFFPFDNGVGRGKPEWTPDHQAETLKALGYDGISYNFTTPEALAAWQKAMDARGLKIYSLYVYTDIGKAAGYPANLENALRLLEGRDTVLWITILGAKGKGERAARDNEAVKLIQDVCALAKKYNVRVAVYGHINHYIETAEDSLRVVEKAGCDNLGASFNLCHDLMYGNANRLGEIIKKTAPKLMRVSISGADLASKKHILRLDQGDLDVAGVVKILKENGYKGPVGLQCFGVPGDVEENLKADMDAWKKITATLENKENK